MHKSHRAAGVVAGSPVEDPLASERASAGKQGRTDAPARLRLEIRGAVQGVGFRPFVHRLAGEEGLAGWVLNGVRGVELEVQGPHPSLRRLRDRIAGEAPAAAVIQEIEEIWLEPREEAGFRIVESSLRLTKSAVILPDLATCAECRRELFDPGDRRWRYPFTNCTHCGPRFSILEDLPYDRPRTTMRRFTMCPDCRKEYEAPTDRRFHAQPNACPQCGPRLLLADAAGGELAQRDDALVAAAEALRAGRILALKGIGGYQLLVDACDERAVGELRTRKRRPSKPLAIMVRDLAAARRLCTLSEAEEELLSSSQAPIVLLRRREGCVVAPAVAPGHPHLGLMLPTTPLHHLLLVAVDMPLVATSGNLSDEPIAIDDQEAVRRLGGIADLFLTHDRPIARHVDDSVVWIADGAPQPLRRARGYAPLPILLDGDGPTLVAVGAHQKDVAALAVGRQVFLSQHIGDMETPEAHAAFERVLLDFVRVYEARPVAIVHDLHPNYATTAWAFRAAEAAGGLLERCGLPAGALPSVPVQHHHAHLAALLAERGERGACLAATWDGTGFGPDGTIWGGEMLLGDATTFERVARLRPFRLPGGEAAVREPWRVALALAWQLEPGRALELAAELAPRRLGERELATLARMVGDGLRSPETSSAGRLFDGVAAIVGLPARVSYEGEAAMQLEFLAAPVGGDAYPIAIAAAPAPEGLAPGQRRRDSLFELDWRPLLAELLADRVRGVPPAVISARFHAGLADAAVEVALRLDAPRLALTGGCFQNRTLTDAVAARARRQGREPLVHRIVPANDGGIALGQVAAARARLATQKGA